MPKSQLKPRRKWEQQEILVEDIVPAELNANKMSDKDFEQLVSNIKKKWWVE